MPPKALIDVLTLAQNLIRCPSVTPADAGALDVLEAALTPLGFRCHRLKFSTPGSPTIENLYARYGEQRPNFCFAGHTDVVPVGDRAHWGNDPFAGTVADGQLFGRGAADMKGAIACFVAAAARTIADFGKNAPGAKSGANAPGAKSGANAPGSISFLITGDEEGPAIDGTVKVLEWMAAQGEVLDACLVGEPTNPQTLGQTIKIGRRGSLTGRLRVLGVQGHVGYPKLADNPLPRLCRMLLAIGQDPIDWGNARFEPSHLEITTIDVGNTAENMIPGKAEAVFNIRFNTEQTAASLETWLRQRLDAIGGQYELKFGPAHEAFLTEPGKLSRAIIGAVEHTLGVTPEFSTTGGTSDARFIRKVCEVAEFGLVGQTMHKIDERVAVADLTALTEIYTEVLKRFFAASSPDKTSIARARSDRIYQSDP
jgi:succinyl-diaminopimelate desuccinylase